MHRLGMVWLAAVTLFGCVAAGVQSTGAAMESPLPLRLHARAPGSHPPITCMHAATALLNAAVCAGAPGAGRVGAAGGGHGSA